MRDIPGGGACDSKCHQISQGWGRRSAKVSRDVFSKTLAAFWYFSLFKIEFSKKKKNCLITNRGVGIGEYWATSPNDTRRRGSKIVQKKCHVLFARPLKEIWTLVSIVRDGNVNSLDSDKREKKNGEEKEKKMKIYLLVKTRRGKSNK